MKSNRVWRQLGKHSPGTETPYTLASWTKSRSVRMLLTSVVETFSPFHLQETSCQPISLFLKCVVNWNFLGSHYGKGKKLCVLSVGWNFLFHYRDNRQSGKKDDMEIQRFLSIP